MRECEDGADNTQKHVREREEDDDAEEYAGLAQLEDTPCEIELDRCRSGSIFDADS